MKIAVEIPAKPRTVFLSFLAENHKDKRRKFFKTMTESRTGILFAATMHRPAGAWLD